MDLVELAKYAALLMALAFLVERVVGHARNLIEEQTTRVPAFVYGLVALLLGIPLGLMLTVDPFAGLFASPLVGKLLAGVLIGGGSNIVHDVLRQFLP